MKNTLKSFVSENGTSIYEQSCAAPMLLILLRHVGCPFCRRTMRELSSARAEIEAIGYTIGIVHMDAEAVVGETLSRFGLEDLPRFHDPEKVLYEVLETKRIPLRALFSPRTWAGGFDLGARYGYAWPDSDPLQLPGAFLVDQGQVTAGHTSLYPAEPPNFRSLVTSMVR